MWVWGLGGVAKCLLARMWLLHLGACCGPGYQPKTDGVNPHDRLEYALASTVKIHCIHEAKKEKIFYKNPSIDLSQTHLPPCQIYGFPKAELTEPEKTFESSQAHQNVGSNFPTADTGGRLRSVRFRFHDVGKPSLCRRCGCPGGFQTPRCRAERKRM